MLPMVLLAVFQCSTALQFVSFSTVGVSFLFLLFPSMPFAPLYLLLNHFGDVPILPSKGIVLAIRLWCSIMCAQRVTISSCGAHLTFLYVLQRWWRELKPSTPIFHFATKVSCTQFMHYFEHIRLVLILLCCFILQWMGLTFVFRQQYYARGDHGFSYNATVAVTGQKQSHVWWHCFWWISHCRWSCSVAVIHGTWSCAGVGHTVDQDPWWKEYRNDWSHTVDDHPQ